MANVFRWKDKNCEFLKCHSTKQFATVRREVDLN
jgi:hypothetical protein